MKSKSLNEANPYLRADNSATRAMRIRSIASSTAISTGESIASIEKKLIAKKRSRYRVTLA